MPEPERPDFTEMVLRLALVVVAFIILWRVEEPTLIQIPSVQVGAVEPEQGPVRPALLAGASGLAAGFLFGLAGRPLSGWTYRPRLPIVLGLIPALIVVVQMLAFSRVLPLTNEGLFGRLSYFLVSDFPLRISAILIGVALAQGVDASGDHANPDDVS
ncbi:MAG: hypothetical protein ACRDH9_03100 [Actinomycetota bacterium]